MVVMIEWALNASEPITVTAPLTNQALLEGPHRPEYRIRKRFRPV
jgi:hypothetical protein